VAPPILVTGAGGFIGSAVVKVLLESGASVRALVGPPGATLRPLPSEVDANVGEITDSQVVESVAIGIDTVIHLAGLPSVRSSFEQPASYADVHVTGTATLLSACRKANIRRFIYVSSAEVYGRPKTDPAHEEHPAEPRSPYGAAKLGAEHFVRAFSVAYGMDCIILRPFSVYGQGLPTGSVLGSILEQARHCSELTLADLRPVRDYVHVTDVAAACAAATSAPLPGCTVINVGTGRGFSVHDLAQRALAALNIEIPIRESGSSSRPPSSDIFRLTASIERARELLGWTPTISLEAGLTDLAQSFHVARS
jgi:nucleoside-diphosphate-sugar epimerase